VVACVGVLNVKPYVMPQDEGREGVMHPIRGL